MFKSTFDSWRRPLPVYDHKQQMRTRAREERRKREGDAILTENCRNTIQINKRVIGVFRPTDNLPSYQVKLRHHQPYRSKGAIRTSFPPFSEECIKSRPEYFTEEWMDTDQVVHKHDVIGYASLIANLDNKLTEGKISTIVRYKDKIIAMKKALNRAQIPASGVKVQWRLASKQKSPTLCLAYVMLNRYATVVALIQLSANSAICVFESIAGALRAVNNSGSRQASLILIVSWWHSQMASASVRERIKQNKSQTEKWLLSQGVGALDNVCTEKTPTDSQSYVTETGSKPPDVQAGMTLKLTQGKKRGDMTLTPTASKPRQPSPPRHNKGHDSRRQKPNMRHDSHQQKHNMRHDSHQQKHNMRHDSHQQKHNMSHDSSHKKHGFKSVALAVMAVIKHADEFA
ncbi:uncharacterized protein LOC131958410 [Physella acuta]|uniref:uncharacterized protein LOC131958410 n=1 Tax=Physella acuta TaxID=109671 RepID=UPI0027DCCD9F|nr:uncharacterized protein LOC131958410 [Physella acuta]